MSTVVKVEGLGKRYQLNKAGSGDAYGSFREQIYSTARSLVKRDNKASYEDFWALRDVSFEISQGDRIGVIGRNGAGKSTLLKILARITEPTSGKVRLKGRVASLLEVGTGFHPELSGRENIFLNGAILGMSKAEIRRKFDEIVSFADVEKFLDTPVKRYSSGMYVRLAFAVAAHLEPEILIVDEVLAVGDAEFQKKCLGRMNELGTEGRTIIFVSHSMSAVSNLCNKAIMLNKGQLSFNGTARDAIKAYFVKDHSDGARVSYEDTYVGDAKAQLLQVWTESNGVESGTFEINESFTINVQYKILSKDSSRYVPNLHFYSSSGETLFVVTQDNVVEYKAGHYQAICVIPPRLLNAGIVFVGVAVTSFQSTSFSVCFFEKDCLSLSIFEDITKTPDRYNYAGEVPGFFRPKLVWHERKLSD